MARGLSTVLMAGCWGIHEYWNEAMPDICFKADEGHDLESVKRIVQAAAEVVSDLEKRATVDKAKNWVKFTFHPKINDNFQSEGQLR